MKRLISIIVLTVVGVGSCSPVPPTRIDATEATPTPLPSVNQTVNPGVAATATSVSPPLTLEAGTTMVAEKDGMTLVYIPAGEFSMGNDSGWKEEKPIHTVELDAFWIDQTEITNAMYAKCVQREDCASPSNPSRFSDPVYANYPVVYVSWNDANQYCAWAGRRLPTEAEWEKAGSGTDERVFPWGDTIDCSFANYLGGESGCVNDTSPVGSYPAGASPYGALDMTGNVLEWVSSLYKQYPYDAADGREDPDMPGTRVLRGGSWNVTAEYTRLSRRDWYFPSVKRNYVGFRCAMSAAP